MVLSREKLLVSERSPAVLYLQYHLRVPSSEVRDRRSPSSETRIIHYKWTINPYVKSQF